MKNSIYLQITIATIGFALLFILPSISYAQGPPPPPGVPLDFGLSALIAGCIGYGALKMKNKSQKD